MWEINYYSPGRFEDIMLGTGWVEKVGNSSVTMGYDFRLKGSKRLIADAKQVVVFREYRPQTHRPFPPIYARNCDIWSLSFRGAEPTRPKTGALG